jgi:hypothetical protein
MDHYTDGYLPYYAVRDNKRGSSSNGVVDSFVLDQPSPPPMPQESSHRRPLKPSSGALTSLRCIHTHIFVSQSRICTSRKRRIHLAWKPAILLLFKMYCNCSPAYSTWNSVIPLARCSCIHPFKHLPFHISSTMISQHGEKVETCMNIMLLTYWCVLSASILLFLIEGYSK